MMKRLMVLAVMLAVTVVAAVPAFAQQGEQVTATGLLELAGQQGDVFYYRIVDEEPTGGAYVLKSETVDLGSYLDQRVTVYGTVESAAGNAPGLGPASPLVDVTRVEPAVGPPPGGSPPDPPPGLPTATLSFDLAVECEPPADAFFEGLILAEGLGHVPLTDPDGDGLYTGSATLPKFPPGPLPVPPDIEPVSLPLQIVQGPPTGATALGPEYRVIEDFGSVKLDEDKTLAASVSFCGDGGSDNSNSGSGSKSGSGSGGSGSDGSGSSDSGSGGSSGSGSGGSGSSANSGSGSGGSGDKSSSSAGGMKVLPKTGGTLPTLGVVGALLVAGGLLVRRATR